MSIKERFAYGALLGKQEAYEQSLPTRFYTPDEIADMKRQTDEQMRFDIENGRIKPTEIDSRWRYEKASLDDRIKRGTKVRACSWALADSEGKRIDELIEP